ncbi:MAG: DUF3047 domain-containing protein [Burkholderiales bacterium]|jgi:hypothetical protein|nr:DUF3047 domain-containing protein [Burkholderiales bacterium]
MAADLKLATAACLLLVASGAMAQPLMAFAREGSPPGPWTLATVPKITAHTQYAVVQLDGQLVLRIQANASYANLLHPVTTDLATRPQLRWRWRVDAATQSGDARRKDGDDQPLRVCVLFEVPSERLSAGVRLQLSLGRALFDPQLPAASICYVWDNAPAGLPAGSWLPNAHTARVQMLVLRSRASDATLGRWLEESRDLAADFARAFPAEAAGGWLPRLAAVGVAGDGDNTGARSVAFVQALRLEAP